MIASGRLRRGAVLALSLLTACEPPKKDHLTIGYIPIAECLPLYVAIDQGFFESEGLEVNLQSLAGGARILEALASGSVDVGFSNTVSLLLQRAAGADFFPIWGATFESAGHQNHALVMAAGGKPSEIARGRVAVNTTRNIEELMVRRFLRSQGVDPALVDFRPIGFPQMLPAIEARNVNAISIVEPFIAAVRANSALQIVANHYLSIAPRVWVATYVTSEAVFSARQQALRRFARAMNRASKFIREHEPDARQALVPYTRLPASAVSSIGLPEFVDSAQISALEDVERLMREENFFPHEGPTSLKLSAMRMMRDGWDK